MMRAVKAQTPARDERGFVKLDLLGGTSLWFDPKTVVSIESHELGGTTLSLNMGCKYVVKQNPEEVRKLLA